MQACCIGQQHGHSIALLLPQAALPCWARVEAYTTDLRATPVYSRQVSQARRVLAPIWQWT